MTHCGAKTKQGEVHCRRPAGWGTDHVGQGRCKLHGGTTPIRHGLYSKIKRPTLQKLIEEVRRSDVDELYLTEEIALLRALLLDFIGQHKGGQPIDAVAASLLIDRLRKVVEASERLRAGGYIPLSCVVRLQEEMGVIIAKHVRDKKVIERIVEGWRWIQVEVRRSA